MTEVSEHSHVYCLWQGAVGSEVSEHTHVYCLWQGAVESEVSEGKVL